jgi:ADP-ribose pyrophosphatase YjhB (NUDIX family)
VLVEQAVTSTRHWGQPGGRLEPGETLEQGLIREMKEETGLDIAVDELLYITERITQDTQVVIIMSRVRRKGGTLGTGHGSKFSNGKIKSVKMIPLDDLPGLGFSDHYCALARAGFPERGTYQKDLL